MNHTAAPPFAFTAGPHDARTVLVGEAHGDQEKLTGLPFMGNAGQALNQLLEEAGIPRKECLLTNVFAFQPLNSSIPSICGKRADVGKDYPHQPIAQGQYVLSQYLPEVARLKAEIDAFPRNLVIALGSPACWALLGRPGIGVQRGAITESTLCPGTKVLPTYHPSYLFKMFQHRPIVLADLMKAARERLFPEVRRPERYIVVQPTRDDIAMWFHKHAMSASMLSIDVETGAGQIKLFGVASSPQHGLVIPFVDLHNPSGCYWPTHDDEMAAWYWIANMMDLTCPKLFQNGLFDLQYILPMGIVPRNVVEDTMLLHHALYPELQKSLGFLGSIYTNEAAWKLMRGATDTEKRDE